MNGFLCAILFGTFLEGLNLATFSAYYWIYAINRKIEISPMAPLGFS